MIRIDVDRYKILYVQYDDHMHRYAVPVYWTVGIMAKHVIDLFDKEKPVKFRRKFDTKYDTFDAHGVRLPHRTTVDVFEEEAYLLVKVEG